MPKKRPPPPSPTPPPATDPLAIPVLPVICEQCRATGLAGDDPFAAIPDILAFAPVPRRAHANGWREEHQRAFIAALAITGSPKQATRAIGRHQFGAEQLRNAKGGRAFAAAWDAALDLARERETMRIRANLAELAERREAELAQLTPSPLGGKGRGEGPTGAAASFRQPDSFPPGYDPEFDDEERREYLEAQAQVRQRMLRARRLLLFIYANDPDPARRQAWETLCGPVDWVRAAANQAEDGAAYAMRSARDADLMVTAEVGFLPDLTGGPDVLSEIVGEALRLHAGEGGEGGEGGGGGGASEEMGQ